MKIADFGFARSLPAASLAETLCGSPLYMAPEILRHEKYDAKADLWSIGAVAFEMTTGKPPFRAANHIELQKRIERNDDRIRFPDERSNTTWLREVERRREAGEHVSQEEVDRGPTPVADDIKSLIRGLLKRRPLDRMSFDEFFSHPLVVANRTGKNVEVGAVVAPTPGDQPPAPLAVDRSPPRPTPGPSLPVQTTPSTRVTAPPTTKIPPLPKFRSKYVVAQQQATAAAAVATQQSGSGGGGGGGDAVAQQATQQSGSSAATAVPTRRPSSNVGAKDARAGSDAGTTPPQRAAPPRRTPTPPPQPPSNEDPHHYTSGDDDSQYVLVEKRNVESAGGGAEAQQQQPSGPAPAGVFASSPLAAGAVNAAARLARRPSRLSRLSSQFGAVGAAGATATVTSPVSPTAAAPARTTASTSTAPTSPAPSTSPTLAPSGTATPPPPAGSSPLASRPASSPLASSPSMPFALPPGQRRPSFAGRRISSGQQLQSGQHSPSPSGTSGTASPRSVSTPLEKPKSTALTTTTAPSKDTETIDEKALTAATTGANAASPPGSALVRAISQASQRWFGVPNALSLRSAAAFINVGVGAAAAPLVGGLKPSPSSQAVVPAGSASGAGAASVVSSDQAEAVLLIHLEDLGKKAFVLCEFADSKLALYFATGPHQPFPFNSSSSGSGSVGGGGEASSMERERQQRRSPSLSSSVNSTGGGGGGRRAGASTPTATAATTTTTTAQAAQVAANEALLIYIKSITFLQKALELVRGFLARSGIVGGVGVGVAQQYGYSAELTDAVQQLRRRFNETYERADFARSRATSSGGGGGVGDSAMAAARPHSASPDSQPPPSPTSATTATATATATVNKLIYEKAMELSRAAALDEMEHSHEPIFLAHHHGGAQGDSDASSSIPTWDVGACLLAYETAEIMLTCLLEPAAADTGVASGAAGGDQTRATVEPFIKSIHKRSGALRKRLASSASVSGGGGGGGGGGVVGG